LSVHEAETARGSKRKAATRRGERKLAVEREGCGIELHQERGGREEDVAAKSSPLQEKGILSSLISPSMVYGAAEQ
jgi:hypothetical protein